jgi:hypothetical protein
MLEQSAPPYTESKVHDAKSGYDFANFNFKAPGNIDIGVSFPSRLDAPHYLGRLVAPRKGWTAVSHSGDMVKTPLLVAWADGQRVQHSLRYATFVLSGVWDVRKLMTIGTISRTLLNHILRTT